MGMSSPRARGAAVLVACAGLWRPADAATRFSVFNETTNTDFSELYLAPSGTTAWGANQTLNDRDRVLDHSERLPLSGVAAGIYDVRIVDTKGRACVLRNVDLRQERSFEIRDDDLAACR